MKQLWAPWRLAYVSKTEKNKKGGCLFCRKQRSRADQRNYVLQRSDLAFALLNIFPYTNGHLMVAPKRHVADIDDLTADELLDIMLLVKDMKQRLQKALHPHGYNIGINCGAVAGAGIKDHLHVHIVPRWNGDTNFMPVFGDVKVIPQSLEALYALLV